MLLPSQLRLKTLEREAPIYSSFLLLLKPRKRNIARVCQILQSVTVGTHVLGESKSHSHSYQS